MQAPQMNVIINQLIKQIVEQTYAASKHIPSMHWLCVLFPIKI